MERQESRGEEGNGEERRGEERRGEDIAPYRLFFRQHLHMPAAISISSQILRRLQLRLSGEGGLIIRLQVACGAKAANHASYILIPVCSIILTLGRLPASASIYACIFSAKHSHADC